MQSLVWISKAVVLPIEEAGGHVTVDFYYSICYFPLHCQFQVTHLCVISHHFICLVSDCLSEFNTNRTSIIKPIMSPECKLSFLLQFFPIFSLSWKNDKKSVFDHRAVKKFDSRLIMNRRRLWNSHQRHKFLRAKATRDIFKIRVSEMVFPEVFKRYFPPRMPCCFIRIHAIMQSRWNVPGVLRHHMVRTFDSCMQCHSKLGKGCFTILFNSAYILLVAMVEGDESSWLKRVVLAGYWPLLTALDQN